LKTLAVVNVFTMTALVASALQAKTSPAGTTISATVTSAGHATNTYPWTIQKAAEPTSQDVASGSNGTVTWTITVSKGAASSTAYFDGQICVTNTGGQPTQNLAIQAQLSKPPSNTILATSAVDVSAHPVLAAGETWCYPCQIAVPPGSIAPGTIYKLTARVTITNKSGKIGTPAGVSANASAKLPSPTVVNGTITVSDTNGQTFDFAASGSRSYSQTVQCSTAHDSSETINNTATIIATGQTAQASASVTCTARTVSGVGATQYFSEASTSPIASVPIDFSTSAVEALVPDGSGGFQSYPGSGASGTFSVPNVPPGQYILRVGNTYVVTDVNAVDLGSSVNGRPTAAVVTQGSLVNVGVGDLEPWQSGDFLEFYAPGAGDWDFGTERFANSGGPFDGDTSVSLSINLGALDGNFPRFHIDSTAGDHAYLVQLSQQTTSSGTTYFALTRTFALPLFSSVDGGSVSAGDYPPNTFARVTQYNSINVDFRGSQFLAALTADGNPNQTFTSALYGVESVPGTAAYAFNVVSADQLLVVLPTDGSDVTTGTMSYGPLPVASNFGHWVDFRDVRFQSRVTYQLPGTVSGTNFVNGLFWTTAGTPANPIVPPLSPPQTIKVDGANFFSDQTLVGLNSTITWSPPVIGVDNGIFAYYRLTIYELDVNPANNRTTRGPVIATLHTPNTSIMLPSLLQSGRTYVLVLEALGGTGYPPLDITKPLQGRVDTVSVMVSSGILTAP
jgi:hypothetical protein